MTNVTNMKWLSLYCSQIRWSNFFLKRIFILKFTNQSAYSSQVGFSSDYIGGFCAVQLRVSRGIQPIYISGRMIWGSQMWNLQKFQVLVGREVDIRWACGVIWWILTISPSQSSQIVSFVETNNGSFTRGFCSVLDLMSRGNNIYSH